MYRFINRACANCKVIGSQWKRYVECLFPLSSVWLLTLQLPALVRGKKLSGNDSRAVPKRLIYKTASAKCPTRPASRRQTRRIERRWAAKRGRGRPFEGGRVYVWWGGGLERGSMCGDRRVPTDWVYATGRVRVWILSAVIERRSGASTKHNYSHTRPRCISHGLQLNDLLLRTSW